MPSAFIDDGYTREETFPATKYYPKTWIQFRPLLSRERYRHADRNAKLVAKGPDGIDEAEKLLTKIVSEQLHDWDLYRDIVTDGEKSQVKVEITPDNLARVEPNLLKTIWQAIAGYANEAVDAESQEEADVKN